ncbi:2Fe-2S iron-sulfur cluster binding domain-containing protein [Galbitalea soli]|uniref:2Fe-2S iron-sulfur cluster binding domain-containing protein n=2 Tax=Galbitalea soli TaxID=1268042 RepID=A0A7C9PP34_9MICO|nr:2Fe-2S iron-sulfur cluster binding domain-containing protein [Galbitalea soli]
MTISVLWGILLSTRVLRRFDNPSWLNDIHAYASGMSILMVLLHMVSLMLDGWLRFSITEVLVPFSAHYRAFPVALGVIAFYLLIAVGGTSLLIKRLPRPFWRTIHYSSYGALILISFHAGFTGTDVGSPWYRWLSLTLIGLASLAIVTRVLVGRSVNRAARPRRDDVIVPRTAPAATASSTAAAAAVPSSPLGGPATPVVSLDGLDLVVVARRRVAEGVVGIRLARADGHPLPVWHPGAHLTLRLPGGLERQYSLTSDPADRQSAEICVRLSPTSEGGSSWIHSTLHEGMRISAVGPSNHFELEPAPSYLFVAGGIGITPILAMIESLPARRDWYLLYIGRSRATMPFAAELLRQYPERVTVFPSDEHALPADLHAFLARGADLVYCCGPESLMDAVAAYVSPERLRIERFVAVVRQSLAGLHSTEVTCRRSKVSFTVPATSSILEEMERHNVPIIGSCRKGVCGTCEVRVLGGVPEHLDSVLDDDRKNDLGIMYPCVSRSSSTELILDV